MNDQTEAVVDETNQETALPTEEASVSEETPEETTEEASEETPEEYSPNLKYTFMDQEYEFDEKIKGFIKTKEDEDFFRDMITAQKAHEKYKEFGGIREVETKLGEYTDLSETKTKYETLNNEINQLQGMLSTGNIEGFRQYLGIDKEVLLDWAIKEAKAMQDPNEAAQLQQQYQQQQQTFDLQYQNELMQNNIRQQEVNRRNAELDQGLEGHDVAKAYDDLVGTQGSFRQAVMDYGKTVWATEQRDVSVPEAIEAVASKFRNLVKSETVGTQNQTQQNQSQAINDPEKTVVINRGGTNTIPNLRGGSTSPAKKKITSLAELKKFADSLDD